MLSLEEQMIIDGMEMIRSKDITSGLNLFYEAQRQAEISGDTSIYALANLYTKIGVCIPGDDYTPPENAIDELYSTAQNISQAGKISEQQYDVFLDNLSDFLTASGLTDTSDQAS